ncbi:MAG: GNAT family N-acetyltransferase [Deltaproteobacteria bacterium RIFOXYA12_FULL_58_15]|nr:MAG: GNAT family N-acetyltransferase [Deltaproteobacteria bacterium RIFOXYA12_FULL_58_15]OGR09793.1 MAG: GNAT family N-acetyltransferase [Deltaproteobacteria bacterium RIFOXYB12_FULL_58_9]
MAESVEVRVLRPADDRSNFESGNIDLDRFFRRFAGQNQFRHHIGATYIAVEGEHVLGFATIAGGNIEIEDLPKTRRKKLPHYPLPILRLARLAVDQSAQGRGVGKLLLRAVFQITRDMAESVGCVGVVVDAKPDAVAFYERYGFEPFEVIEGALGSRPEPLPMFLPLGEIPRV